MNNFCRNNVFCRFVQTMTVSLLLSLISASSYAYSTSGNLPLQVEPNGSSWNMVVADATAQSTGASSGGTPIYHSTKLEQATLEGDFTADINTTSLAVFSDDGCDVTIDGNNLWTSKGRGQALPVLSESLHRLSVTLNPGQKYHIKIEYSNIIYTGSGDVDGVTLFTWSDPLNVKLDLSNVDNIVLTEGVQGSGPIKASVLNAPQTTTTCTVIGITWDWDFGKVDYSEDGQAIWGNAPTGVGYEMTIDNASSQNAIFNMTLDPGYWSVALSAVVTYHTTCGDISGTASDYVGQPY